MPSTNSSRPNTVEQSAIKVKRLVKRLEGIDENNNPQDHAVSDIAELGVGFDDNGFQWAKA